MWFNEKNAIKKLARNLHNDMKKMNVITIETVKHYDTIYWPINKISADGIEKIHPIYAPGICDWIHYILSLL